VDWQGTPGAGKQFPEHAQDDLARAARTVTTAGSPLVLACGQDPWKLPVAGIAGMTAIWLWWRKLCTIRAETADLKRRNDARESQDGSP